MRIKFKSHELDVVNLRSTFLATMQQAIPTLEADATSFVGIIGQAVAHTLLEHFTGGELEIDGNPVTELDFEMLERLWLKLGAELERRRVDDTCPYNDLVIDCSLPRGHLGEHER